MSTPPFIPRADAKFNEWASVFVKGISENPWMYGLAPADGETLMRRYNEFAAAYALATGEGTRTKVAVAEKDTARNALEGLCRRYAAIIRTNNGVSDGAKIAIGVRPPNLSRQRRVVPGSSPLLNFIASTPGGNVLHFADSMNRGKAKPFGAERLELWVAFRPVGTKPEKSQLPPQDAQFVRAYRKNPINVEHDFEKLSAGLAPTYWGRWAGFHDDVGPWSLPCSMHIAAKAKQQEEQKKPSDPDEGQSMKLAA